MAQVLKEEVRNRILEAAEKVFYKTLVFTINESITIPVLNTICPIIALSILFVFK